VPDAPQPALSSSAQEWLLAGALLVVTFLTYIPVLRCGFVNYDDNVYVTERPELQLGLSGPGIRWACTAVVSANWHPLTLLSLLLDHDLFGAQAWGYHLTNLLLHLANTFLWYRCLCRMTGAVGRSAVVAALFALHPIHVEAVAWVGDRTDLLSTFFGLLALRAHLWHVAAPSLPRLGTSTLLLALSFMAKPIWLTFPFLLLLLDFWPLRRTAAGVSWRRLVLEKVPFLLVVAAGSAIALVVHSREGLIAAGGGRYSLAARVGNALISYGAYVRQTFVPIDLAVLYPHPGENVSLWAAVGAGLLLVAVSALVVSGIRSHPEWFVGWFWFIGTLLPLVGIVQFREVARADRYTYVAHVGLFLALTWAVAELLERAPRPHLGLVVAGVVLSICVVFTESQLACWKDSLTLWEHTLRVTVDNAQAHINYGDALWRKGRLHGALKEYDAYVKLRPNESRGYRSRGHVLYMASEEGADASLADRAIADYQTALSIDHNLPDVHLTLGAIRLDRGQLAEAAESFRTALSCDFKRVSFPLSEAQAGQVQAKAWYNLGRVEVRRKDFAKADECFVEALRLQPDDVDTHVERADALAASGRFREAVALVDRVLARIGPDANPAFVGALRERLRCFEKGQVFRAE
jgi:tetratricopeptide (TPR) repeat protein